MEAAGQRWLKFRAFLAEQRLQAGEIHAVYYEDVKQHAGTLAAHVYGGFLACLEMWCAANNVPLRRWASASSRSTGPARATRTRPP
jgi:hypothetical protein